MSHRRKIIQRIKKNNRAAGFFWIYFFLGFYSTHFDINKASSITILYTISMLAILLPPVNNTLFVCSRLHHRPGHPTQNACLLRSQIAVPPSSLPSRTRTETMTPLIGQGLLSCIVCLSLDLNCKCLLIDHYWGSPNPALDLKDRH